MKHKQPEPAATPPGHPEDEPGAFLAEDTAVLYGAADAVTRVKQGLALREFDVLHEMLVKPCR